MSIKRRDNKNRVLRNGESQRKDGRYMYKYQNLKGESKYIYSWRLVPSDKAPDGKKDDICLRDQIKLIQTCINEDLDYDRGTIKVIDLVRKYISQKIGVRINTRAGYKTVINVLEKDEFGYLPINKIKPSNAKEWFIELQKNGRSYSSIHNIRGVIRPAFEMAVQDDILNKNPFNFPLVDVVVNDSITRQAITREEERRFLIFIKNDPHFQKYYDAIYILFKTGFRISEFCGLTIHDIDLENRTVKIERQLQYRGNVGFYIEQVKTENGNRIFPILEKDTELYECFKRLILDRKPPKKEPVIDGISGFLLFSSTNKPYVGYQWSKIFNEIVEKHNKIYKQELPKITPHICRHTFCTNMVKSGVSPKAVQKLMGHSGIEITLDVYTHYDTEELIRQLEVADVSSCKL